MFFADVRYQSRATCAEADGAAVYLCGRDCRGWRQVSPPREKEGDFLLGLRLSPLPFSYQRAMERAPPLPFRHAAPPQLRSEPLGGHHAFSPSLLKAAGKRNFVNTYRLHGRRVHAERPLTILDLTAEFTQNSYFSDIQTNKQTNEKLYTEEKES